MPTVHLDQLRTLPELKPSDSHPLLEQLALYLAHAGYLSDGAPHGITLTGKLLDALQRFQERYHLHVRGHLTFETIKLMVSPQCGVRDAESGALTARGPWKLRHLRFAVGAVSPGIDREKFLFALRSAFQTWQNAPGRPLSFQEVPWGSAHEISVEWRNKNDPDKNMEGADIAHADFPPGFRIIGNDRNAVPIPLHFDSSEPWCWGAVPGAFDIQTIALHELGHCLGFEHCSDSDSIMYRYNDKNRMKRALTDDVCELLPQLYPHH